MHGGGSYCDFVVLLGVSRGVCVVGWVGGRGLVDAMTIVVPSRIGTRRCRP